MDIELKSFFHVGYGWTIHENPFLNLNRERCLLLKQPHLFASTLLWSLALVLCMKQGKTRRQTTFVEECLRFSSNNLEFQSINFHQKALHYAIAASVQDFRHSNELFEFYIGMMRRNFPFLVMWPDISNLFNLVHLTIL